MCGSRLTFDNHLTCIFHSNMFSLYLTRTLGTWSIRTGTCARYFRLRTEFDPLSILSPLSVVVDTSRLDSGGRNHPESINVRITGLQALPVWQQSATVPWNTPQLSSSAGRTQMYLGAASVLELGYEDPGLTEVYTKRRRTGVKTPKSRDG